MPGPNDESAGEPTPDGDLPTGQDAAPATDDAPLAEEGTPAVTDDEAPADAEAQAADAEAQAADAEAGADAPSEDGSDWTDEDDEDDEPPARRRAVQIGALVGVISGLLLGGGLFLPYASSGGTESGAMTIDLSQASWVFSAANLAIPALVLLAGLAVLGGFMRPAVGAGVMLTAGITRLLTAAAAIAFLAMVGPTAQVGLASGYYVLAVGGLLALTSGAILLTASRRRDG